VVLTTKAITEEQGKGFALGAAELEGKAAESKLSHARTKGIRSPVPTTVFVRAICDPAPFSEQLQWKLMSLH
jgi:hypothetical protein